MPLDFRYHYQGFSLLEVLIAIVVLSVGLLGLAGLQFSALRGNNQTYERSQAHLLAQEIADSMRANRIAAGASLFVLDPGTPPDDPPVDCRVGACDTPALSAAYSLDQWYTKLTETLPSATARIRCEPAGVCAVGVVHTVQIMWDEYRVGLAVDDDAATSCPSVEDGFDQGTNLSCVRVSFIP